ncbi:MAG: M48 family metallopeptidase [Vulcanimicrobiaceae bacterium]
MSAIAATTLVTQPGYRLVDARRQRAGVNIRHFQRPLFFVWALSQIAGFFALWRSGTGARLRDAMRRRISNVFALRFAFGAVLLMVSSLAAFPASLARYRIDYIYGLTTENALGWYRDGLVGTLLYAVVVGAIVACVFALVDRTRLWYAYAMGGLFIVTLVMAFVEPVIVAPLYNSVTPLSKTSATYRRLQDLAAKAHIGHAPIYVADSSRRTPAAIADIAGFGPTKRIVLSDSLLADTTPGEVLVVAAREFGHDVHGDDFRLSLFWTSLFILCTALAVLAADRVGFRRDDDPLARLPLVFAFLGILGLVATPLYNAYSRTLEANADAFALALTGDRVSTVRVYVRIADETLAQLCPSRASRLYFYNSPPLGTRIAAATGHADPCR